MSTTVERLDDLRRNHRYVEAETEAQKLLETPERAVGLATLGRLHFWIGSYELAASWLEEAAMQADPPDPEEPGWLACLVQRARHLGQSHRPEPAALKHLKGPEHSLWLDRTNVAHRGQSPATAPAFDELETPELLLAGLHQHRVRCERRPLQDGTAEEALAYLDATKSASSSWPSRPERLLRLESCAERLVHEEAMIRMALGQFPEADALLSDALGMRPEAHISLLMSWVQCARALAVSREDRLHRIERAHSELERLNEFGNRQDPSVQGPARVFYARHVLHLARQKSLVVGSDDPEGAYRICADADRQFGELPHTRLSYARLRYLTRFATDLNVVQHEIDEVVTNLDAPGITPDLFALAPPDVGNLIERIDRLSGKPPPFSDDEARNTERALLAAADTLRALGRDQIARAWYDALVKWFPDSGLTRGRQISLLSSLGDHQAVEDSLTTADKATNADRSEYLDQEKARYYLAVGRYDDARAEFCALATSDWRWTAIEGWTGLIDTARRRRDVELARRHASEALEALNGCGEEVLAEIDIALGWVETQLGNPRHGLRLLLKALRAIPADVGAWSGVLRGLRLLGAHDEALEVCQQLLGEASGRRELGWWDTGGNGRPIQDLTLRHGGRIRSEYGWALLDLGRRDEARKAFDLALNRSPNLAAAYRGLVVAGAGDRRSLLDAEKDAFARLNRSIRNRDGLTRDIHLEVGREMLNLGERTEARRRFDEVRARLPRDTTSFGLARRFLYAIADAYLDQKMVPEAAACLREVRHRSAGAADPTWADLDEREVIANAKLLMAGNRPREARAQLRERRKLTPTAVSEAFRIAQVIADFECREFNRALESCREIGLDEPVTANERLGPIQDIPHSQIRTLLESWIWLAQSELPENRGKEKELITNAAACLDKTDETSVEEIHLRAIVEARRAALGEGSYPAARQYMMQAIERRPYDPALRRDLGAIELAVGDIDKAIEALHEAKHSATHDARVSLLLGAAQFEVGQVGPAIQNFKAAAAVDQHDYVHHRALVVALLEVGQVDDALTAVRQGLATVTTPRRVRLELLHARVRAERAETLHERQRANELAQAERSLKAAAAGRRSPASEKAELLARRAFLAARQGEVRRANTLVASALKVDPSCDEARHLRTQLDLGPKGLPRWLAPSVPVVALGWLVAFLLTLGAVGWSVLRPGSEVRAETQLIFLGMVALAPLVLLLAPRISSLSLFDVTVELEGFTPVEEKVHVDLDLSASQLIRVSGFSNHRPSVSYDDAEPRVLGY